MARLSGERFCFTHSPRATAYRRTARQKGGRATRTRKAVAPARVAEIGELQRHIGWVLADVLLRDNTERRALAVARLVEVGRRLIEQGELERRLELMEQRMNAMEQLA
jgi:hypothetical protein